MDSEEELQAMRESLLKSLGTLTSDPADDFTPIEERMVELAYIGNVACAEADIRTVNIILKHQGRGISLEELCASWE